MDILWISYKGDCLDIARTLRDEGHNVLVYIQELPYTLPVDDAIGYVSSLKPYYQYVDFLSYRFLSHINMFVNHNEIFSV